MKRIILAITGASGAIYGVRIAQVLRDVGDVETHLVISPAARRTILQECDISAKEIEALAHVVHNHADIGAPISSGSFRVHGMIVAPCSVKTMSNIATGNSGDLISRAADVMLKERRPLLLVVRETPLHAGHLENMLKLARLGAVMFPPVPAFYHRPQTIAEIVDQSVMRILDQLDIETSAAERWSGTRPSRQGHQMETELQDPIQDTFDKPDIT